ncbi:hypothetical protein [Paracoccus laeviglucosivorans]|uniref:Uncharacterized protein n=1 Tax=Paracoccus laeviglucosivorans TaxID=1197861 RepID=A0A521FUS3_9RHOB|nr:hypothetical protein [Paracoccus laeviglucosivorans]SMO99923.1 hypothetical protein SAMN06265221_1521 [Paracoccus laeviglucosivorans]
MIKTALVIGHNARSQVAVRVTDRRIEYNWNGVLADAIRECAPDQYVVIRRAPGTGEIGRAYREVNASGAKVA